MTINTTDYIQFATRDTYHSTQPNLIPDVDERNTISDQKVVHRRMTKKK